MSAPQNVPVNHEPNEKYQNGQHQDAQTSRPRVSPSFSKPIFGQAVLADRLIDFGKTLPPLGSVLLCLLKIEVCHDSVHLASRRNIAKTQAMGIQIFSSQTKTSHAPSPSIPTRTKNGCIVGHRGIDLATLLSGTKSRERFNAGG
ncbi:hypothetical protein [Sphingobium sp. D43FB]|uniref:hypothetical protein n=1 Tax=Sphingobium sp. D43FB TaxID=2017595 RepID=UPI0015966D23